MRRNCGLRIADCGLAGGALFLTTMTAIFAAEELPAIDAAGLPPRTVDPFLPARPVPAWLGNHLRVGHLPGSLPMAREFLNAGYQVVTLNVLGNWEVVGPSAGLYPAERVKRAEEYMRAHVEACHAAGAKAVFYIGPVQVPSGNEAFAGAHPEWLRIRPSGKPDPTPNFASIRSGYADWLLAQLAYVTREFKVDGYWFDGYAPVHLHTYDPATRKAYREFTGGADIPPPLEDDPAKLLLYDPVRDAEARRYLAWHEAHFVRFADRMREAIRRENPQAAIWANHSANRTWYFPDQYMGEYPLNYSSAIDVSSVELYWDVPGDPLYQQFVYAFLQGITRERGGSVWIQPSAHGISGISSPVEIQLRGLEGAPWGVLAEFVESTGREEYYKLHLENLKAREEWMRDADAVPYLGIVASEGTRRLFSRGALPLYFSHTLGAFRSYVEKHLPVRVLTECDLEDADLRGIRVLVLPDVAVLSDRAAEVIRRFVDAGGGLIATFETSLHDSDYRRRPDFALADLFRARYISTDAVAQRTEQLTLTLDADHPIVDDPLIRAKQATAWLDPGHPPARGPLALVASAARVAPLPGGQVLATYAVSDPRKDASRHPAIIASEHGKGRVVFFPAAVDKAMFFYPDTFQRQLLSNACRWAARDVPPPLEVKGPLILTATFRRQTSPRRLVVHLLNQASSWGLHSIYQKLAPLPEELNRRWGFPDQSELRGTWPVREEVIPLTGVRVTCRVPGVTRSHLEPGSLELPLEKIDGGVEVAVPKVEMHCMVVFE